MLRLWVSVPMTGTGTDDDPYRPDLSVIASDVAGWSLAGTNGHDAVVYIVTGGRFSYSVIAARLDVIEIDEIDDRGYRLRIPERTRTAVRDRLEQIGVRAVQLEAVDVNPRGLVG